MSSCWACHGWGHLDKQDTGETSWSGRLGERRDVQPIYRLVPAFGTSEGELIECPFCDGTGEPR